MLNGRTTQSVNRSTGWFKYSFEPRCNIFKRARVLILAHFVLQMLGASLKQVYGEECGHFRDQLFAHKWLWCSQKCLLCNIVDVHRSVCLVCNIVLYKGAPNICWCRYLWICLKEGQVLISRNQRLPLFPAQIFTTIVIIMIWNQILSNQSNTSFSMFTRSQEESRLEDCAANRWKIAIVYALVVHATVCCTSAMYIV